MILTIQGSDERDGSVPPVGFWVLLIRVLSGLWNRTRTRRGRELGFGDRERSI